MPTYMSITFMLILNTFMNNTIYKSYAKSNDKPINFFKSRQRRKTYIRST